MQYSIKELFDIFLSGSPDIEIRSTTVESDELYSFTITDTDGETVTGSFFPHILTTALYEGDKIIGKSVHEYSGRIQCDDFSALSEVYREVFMPLKTRVNPKCYERALEYLRNWVDDARDEARKTYSDSRAYERICQYLNDVFNDIDLFEDEAVTERENLAV